MTRAGVEDVAEWTCLRSHAFEIDEEDGQDLPGGGGIGGP
jgi:hypothetical protein